MPITATTGLPTLVDPVSREYVYPTELTCKVPLKLNPENLKLNTQVMGDPSLTVSWDHPVKKKPENGYKVVVVPFADSMTALPKLHYVGKDETSLILQGADFDPFLEYSVSVVALHNEALHHDNPNGPEFTVRAFTGQYIKSGGELREAFVSPDSCCKNQLYNSADKLCCGGTL